MDTKLDLEVLSKRYRPNPEIVPPCPECRSPRAIDVPSINGSLVVWSCSALTMNGDEFDRYHFARSRLEQQPGDPDVLALIDSVRNLQAAAASVLDHLEAADHDEEHVSIPVETLRRLALVVKRATVRGGAYE